MTILEKVRRLYESYLEQAHQAERDRKPLEGVLGFGPRTSPCHNRFAKALETLLKAADGENMASGEVRVVLEHIYRAPKENREPSAAYWMLTAVHGYTLELIGRLNREDAEALWAEYHGAYRRWERLPMQNQVLSALDRARKGK